MSTQNKMPCAVCGKPKDRGSLRIFQTTEKEREQMKALGEASPAQEYGYCTPCLRIFQDRVTASNYLKGLVQIHAQASGVPAEQAERIANKYFSRLGKTAS